MPPQDGLFMGERVEGELAVVPPEPALAHSSKWQRVHGELHAIRDRERENGVEIDRHTKRGGRWIDNR